MRKLNPFCYILFIMPFYVYRLQHDHSFSSNFKQKTFKEIRLVYIDKCMMLCHAPRTVIFPYGHSNF